jgi:hypothetical protein
MVFRRTAFGAFFFALAAPVAVAQDTPPAGQPEPIVINREFCLKPENAEFPQCAELLEGGATNLGPLVGGGIGVLGLAGLAGGGSTSTTTTGTTTTGTN